MKQQHGNNARSTAAQRELSFVIIGAGIAGILSAIKLQQAGYRNILVLEKAAQLGGTWRDNTYPGVACDVPSHFYSYSFAPNPHWSYQYSPGHEIQAYLQRVAADYEIPRLIRYGEEVTDCTFDDGAWLVCARSGLQTRADVVIACTGVTHHPNIPDIAGLHSFTGASFHSARWNHDVALDGQRIGVIGTGSSAVQIVAALTQRAGSLSLFQRTAQWIMPLENKRFTAEEQAELASNPAAMSKMRAIIERRVIENFSDAVVDASAPRLQVIEQLCRENLENTVQDLRLREQLRPTYRVACKRLVLSPDFYQAIQRPNARLVTAGIDAVEARGVRTRDQQLHELDVLILATGFHTHQFLRPMNVVGPAGVPLDVLWNDGPHAYLAVAVPGLPNFFMLNGPGSPVGNFPLIEVAESQLGYVMQLIELLRVGQCRHIAPTAAASAQYNLERELAARQTVWNTGCSSWYLDATGRPTAWPWTIARFRSELATPRLDAYDMSG